MTCAHKFFRLSNVPCQGSAVVAVFEFVLFFPLVESPCLLHRSENGFLRKAVLRFCTRRTRTVPALVRKKNLRAGEMIRCHQKGRTNLGEDSTIEEIKILYPRRKHHLHRLGAAIVINVVNIYW